MQITDDMLTPDELAGELRVTRRTLERWHAQRIGPPRIKFGKQVRYRAAAVRQWLEAQECADCRAGEAA